MKDARDYEEVVLGKQAFGQAFDDYVEINAFKAAAEMREHENEGWFGHFLERAVVSAVNQLTGHTTSGTPGYIGRLELSRLEADRIARIELGLPPEPEDPRIRLPLFSEIPQRLQSVATTAANMALSTMGLPSFENPAYYGEKALALRMEQEFAARHAFDKVPGAFGADTARLLTKVLTSAVARLDAPDAISVYDSLQRLHGDVIRQALEGQIITKPVMSEKTALARIWDKTDLSAYSPAEIDTIERAMDVFSNPAAVQALRNLGTSSPASLPYFGEGRDATLAQSLHYLLAEVHKNKHVFSAVTGALADLPRQELIRLIKMVDMAVTDIHNHAEFLRNEPAEEKISDSIQYLRDYPYARTAEEIYQSLQRVYDKMPSSKDRIQAFLEQEGRHMKQAQDTIENDLKSWDDFVKDSVKTVTAISGAGASSFGSLMKTITDSGTQGAQVLGDLLKVPLPQQAPVPFPTPSAPYQPYEPDLPRRPSARTPTPTPHTPTQAPTHPPTQPTQAPTLPTQAPTLPPQASNQDPGQDNSWQQDDNVLLSTIPKYDTPPSTTSERPSHAQAAVDLMLQAGQSLSMPLMNNGIFSDASLASRPLPDTQAPSQTQSPAKRKKRKKKRRIARLYYT